MSHSNSDKVKSALEFLLKKDENKAVEGLGIAATAITLAKLAHSQDRIETDTFIDILTGGGR